MLLLFGGVRKSGNHEETIGRGGERLRLSVENRLVGSGAVHLLYDPLGRLYEVWGGGSASPVEFLYDGDELVAEYAGTGAMLRRYVHGAGVDDPLVWYEGAAMAGRRFLHTDSRGSVVALADETGGAFKINSYDSWGIPQCQMQGNACVSTNDGRFQYAGQAWIGELGLYHYKARFCAGLRDERL